MVKPLGIVVPSKVVAVSAAAPAAAAVWPHCAPRPRRDPGEQQPIFPVARRVVDPGLAEDVVEGVAIGGGGVSEALRVEEESRGLLWKKTGETLV